MDYVKLVGHRDPTVFTTEYVFETDEETGEVTTAARVGEPVRLSADQIKLLKERGFLVEDSTKEEYEAFTAASAGAAPDVVGSAPVLAASSNPPSSVASSVDQDDDDKRGSGRKNS